MIRRSAVRIFRRVATVLEMQIDAPESLGSLHREIAEPTGLVVVIDQRSTYEAETVLRRHDAKTELGVLGLQVALVKSPISSRTERR